MAVDIHKADTNQPIKHYSAVVHVANDTYKTMDDRVKNTPVIGDIDDKYDDRFDDVGYYA